MNAMPTCRCTSYKHKTFTYLDRNNKNVLEQILTKNAACTFPRYTAADKKKNRAVHILHLS